MEPLLIALVALTLGLVLLFLGLPYLGWVVPAAVAFAGWWLTGIGSPVLFAIALTVTAVLALVFGVPALRRAAVTSWLMPLMGRVLPRMSDPQRGFVLFIVGLALAEACGILGIFLGGPYRDSLFALGMLGIGQWVPFFAKKLYDPKGSGFIPNN